MLRRGLTCQQMELGPPDESGRRTPVPVACDPFHLEADTIIAAVGQQPDFSPFTIDPALTPTSGAISRSIPTRS